MKYYLVGILSLLTFFACAKQDEQVKQKVCVLQTNLGTMIFRFFEKDAPKTSKYFQKLVKEGFYNGKIFYRIVKGHVIQAGDQGESGKPTIKDEFNANPHIIGAVGLAHGADPNSGSTEFYICLVPRPHLDGKYTVFGQLIEGLDILEKIGNVEVNEQYIGDSKIAFHEPKEPVIIKKASIELRNVK